MRLVFVKQNGHPSGMLTHAPSAKNRGPEKIRLVPSVSKMAIVVQGGTVTMLKSLTKALSVAALLMMATSGHAKETVVWWDFLGGGDGVRMKSLIQQFNEEHADAIEIQATTLEWGVPFYTKAQTAAAVGEGSDVMTYHLSRVPLASRLERSER